MSAPELNRFCQASSYLMTPGYFHLTDDNESSWFFKALTHRNLWVTAQHFKKQVCASESALFLDHLCQRPPRPFFMYLFLNSGKSSPAFDHSRDKLPMQTQLQVLNLPVKIFQTLQRSVISNSYYSSKVQCRLSPVFTEENKHP